MKRFFLMFAVLFTVNSFSLALPYNQLRYENSPLTQLDIHLPNYVDVTLIEVDSEGTVTGRQCLKKSIFKTNVFKSSFVDCHSKQTLGYLSTQEIEEMQIQIEEARAGEIVYPQPGDIKCLAIPTESRLFTAEQGSILLSSGTFPCGARTYNASQGATALIELLEKYSHEYNKLLTN